MPASQELRLGTRDDLRITISRDEDVIFFRVEGSELSAAAGVYHDAADGFPAYFRDMAEKWHGWDGALEWAALEGTCRLSATRDRSGHVFLALQLDNSVPRKWRVQATVRVDAGELEHIARRVGGMFVDEEHERN